MKKLILFFVLFAVSAVQAQVKTLRPGDGDRAAVIGGSMDIVLKVIVTSGPENFFVQREPVEYLQFAENSINLWVRGELVETWGGGTQLNTPYDLVVSDNTVYLNGEFVYTFSQNTTGMPTQVGTFRAGADFDFITPGADKWQFVGPDWIGDDEPEPEPDAPDTLTIKPDSEINVVWEAGLNDTTGKPDEDLNKFWVKGEIVGTGVDTIFYIGSHPANKDQISYAKSIKSDDGSMYALIVGETVYFYVAAEDDSGNVSSFTALPPYYVKVYVEQPPGETPPAIPVWLWVVIVVVAIVVIVVGVSVKARR